MNKDLFRFFMENVLLFAVLGFLFGKSMSTNV
uniref:Uncharacterized protein n=1 Tax=Siphoviridae sp. ct0Bp21 TaxID=2825291 RepID=A0A8S5V2L4_9CAUD|nr:MAG TPA: hypothetical protein [Siphoviridae sp. ct0Bp21]